MKKLFTFWRHMGIKRQLYFAYIVAGVIPVMIIAVISVGRSYNTFSSYNEKLLQSYSERVSTTLFEITTQVYNVSEKITYDSDLWDVLGEAYNSSGDANVALADETVIADAMYNYNAIEGVTIYTQNPTIENSDNYVYANEGIRKQLWYQKALSRVSAFWCGMKRSDKYGNTYWNLCLVRKIPSSESNYTNVLVIKLSDDYLRTRLSENEYDYAIAVDTDMVFLSNTDEYYGADMDTLMPVDYNEENYIYHGTSTISNEKYMVYGSVSYPYKTDSKIYICALNKNIYERIMMSVRNSVAAVVLALLVPLIIIHFFSDYLSGRIIKLRGAMHNVAEGNYDVPYELGADDEISAAFSDLVDTAKQIEEKNARIYEVQLAENEMQLKMLQSQINPHFLYNTLETIRMKALTNGDREAADAIKSLGKILRFSLENSNKNEVRLSESMKIIENYLSIMKLRFGERLTYEINIDKEITPENTMLKPLMIQPVVENAILHGIAESENGGKVTIHITTEIVENETKLIIIVSDDGEGMSESTLTYLIERMKGGTESGRHIGLANIYRRIKLGYGEQYDVLITSELGVGTSVTLIIPYITVE
ncbi:MAG: sensor histidine kinase [Catonella sp.]|nr:sensor histidine kinase [Catonella sp.]MDY6357306.1 sensor histidine kinase [Catonella sp.]